MAVALFSGGQDSTTLLLWARQELQEPLQALSFSYGQRHSVELEAAARIAQKLGIPHTILDWGPFWERLGVPSALTAAQPIETLAEGLPTSFVPGRNLFFLTAAAVWGYPRGETTLLIGASEVDYSGYPDCRGDFLEAAQRAIGLALERPVRILAPFLHWNKAQLWRYVESLGYREFVAEETHTCYLGERTRRHPWGYGCGQCPACQLRAAGYAQAFG